MKKARMNISHFRFILFNLKIFGEIVTTAKIWNAIPNHIKSLSYSKFLKKYKELLNFTEYKV